MAKYVCSKGGKFNIYNTVSKKFFFERGVELEHLKGEIEFHFGIGARAVLLEKIDVIREHGTAIEISVKDLLKNTGSTMVYPDQAAKFFQ